MFPGAFWISFVLAAAVPAFFILTWVTSCYHRLNNLRGRYAAAYAHLDQLLKKRYELLLTLVEAARESLPADPGLAEALLVTRNTAYSASVRAAHLPGETLAMKELSGAETSLKQSLQRVALAFNAKAPERRLAGILEELGSLQAAIASAGDAYNRAAMTYNALRVTFPNSLFSLPFGFGNAEPFLQGSC